MPLTTSQGQALEAHNAEFSMNDIERKIGDCRALAPCAFARGTCAIVQRRIDRRYGMPVPVFIYLSVQEISKV